LAPYFEGQPAPKKCLAAFFMTDESYASSYTHFRLAASDEGENRLRYMLGAGWNIYLFWGLSSAVGYLSGNLIPEILEPAFSFAMAAAFLSMLLPIVRDLPTVAAVLTSAAVAVAGALWLPGKWYILLATFAGSLVGFLFGEAKARRKKEAQA
ncbi:MAG: AzlC family ABC transporter permease, partial [Acutalibacteraceae bacterium]